MSKQPPKKAPARARITNADFAAPKTTKSQEMQKLSTYFPNKTKRK